MIGEVTTTEVCGVDYGISDELSAATSVQGGQVEVVATNNADVAEPTAQHTMSKITLDIPDDAIDALGRLPTTAGEEVRMAAAVKLYEMGRLSTGAAARLAGVPRVQFLSRLSEYGVATFDIDPAELDQETRLA